MRSLPILYSRKSIGAALNSSAIVDDKDKQAQAEGKAVKSPNA